MFFDILPDAHGMRFFAVERPVYKFHLGDLIVQEELQLFFYQIQAAETHLFINGGHAIAAGKRTAPAALIVNDPVFKNAKIPVHKRDLIQIHQKTRLVHMNLSILISPGNSVNLFQAFALWNLQKLRQSLLPFPVHY